MSEYKLSPAFFAKLQKRSLYLGLPFMIASVAVGLWISITLIARVGDKSFLTSPCLYITILLCIVVVIFSWRRSVRQQIQMWSSYRLVTNENSIKRTQDGLADMMINYNEIFKVIEAPERGLTIYTPKSSQRINVPRTLENYSEFRLELSRRIIIEKALKVHKKWSLAIPIAMGLLTLAASATMFLSDNRYVIAITGTPLIIVCLFGLISIQRNMTMTKPVKRSSWLIFLPLLAIAARTFFAITGK